MCGIKVYEPLYGGICIRDPYLDEIKAEHLPFKARSFDSVKAFFTLREIVDFESLIKLFEGIGGLNIDKSQSSYLKHRLSNIINNKKLHL